MLPRYIALTNPKRSAISEEKCILIAITVSHDFWAIAPTIHLLKAIAITVSRDFYAIAVVMIR
jgi:hypothetical protein